MPIRLRRLARFAAVLSTGLMVVFCARSSARADRADTEGPPDPSYGRAAGPASPQQPFLSAADPASTARQPAHAAATAQRPASQSGELKPVEGGQIVARIGGEVVLAADVLVGWEEFLTQNGGQISARQRDELRQMFMKKQLDQLVDTKLLYANARQSIPAEAFPKIEETLGEKFEEERIPHLMKVTKTSRRNELEAKLHSMGTSLARRRQSFTETVLAQQWLRQSVQGEAEITYDDLWDYYQQHLADFDIKARVRWEEIAARFDRFPSKQDARSAVEQWGNAVWYRPESLAEVARKHSHGVTADDGGRYDWTSQGSLRSDVVDAALFSLPIGTLSKVLEDDTGYRIVRVTERQAAGRTPFTEAQTEIREQITEQRRKTQVQTYIARLRDTTPMWTAFDDQPDTELR